MTDPVPPAPVAIVTGGTHGIGRACVERLAAMGWRVVFQGRDAEAGAALASSGDLHYVPGDLTSDETVATLVARAEALGGGEIAGLVNNAGKGLRRSFADSSLADWDDVLALNARSAFAVTKAALAGLRRARGSIVFVSSVAGRGGEADLSIYSASKAALIGLAQSLALEFGEEIRTNVVCPGQIATRMMKRVTEDPGLAASVAERIAQRRLGGPEEVAELVAWLVSDRSSYVNGAVIPVDGGETAGLLPLVRAPKARPAAQPV